MGRPRRASRRAASIASRVLPTPPGPRSVSSRVLPSRGPSPSPSGARKRVMAASSASRPQERQQPRAAFARPVPFAIRREETRDGGQFRLPPDQRRLRIWQDAVTHHGLSFVAAVAILREYSKSRIQLYQTTQDFSTEVSISTCPARGISVLARMYRSRQYAILSSASSHGLHRGDSMGTTDHNRGR
jgi:hypothetical protein